MMMGYQSSCSLKITQLFWRKVTVGWYSACDDLHRPVQKYRSDRHKHLTEVKHCLIIITLFNEGYII